MNEKEQKLLNRWSKLLGEPEVSESFKQIELKIEKNAKEKRLLESFEKTLQKITTPAEEEPSVVEPEPLVEEVIQEKSFIDAALANAKTVTQPTYQVPEPQPKLPEKDFVTPGVEKLSKGEEIPPGFRKEMDLLKKSVMDLHSFASRISQMGGGGGAGSIDELDVRTVAVSSNYTMKQVDHYVGVNCPTNCTITLPNNKKNGHMVVVKDESGNCSINQITLVAQAGATIDNDTSAVMAINNMALKLIYRNGWRII
jgi:hypothetical protein